MDGTGCVDRKMLLRPLPGSWLETGSRVYICLPIHVPEMGRAWRAAADLPTQNPIPIFVALQKRRAQAHISFTLTYLPKSDLYPVRPCPSRY